MKATLYIGVDCVEHDKAVIRHFVKDVQVDGVITIADEIQLVGNLKDVDSLEGPYVVKISQAKIRRLIMHRFEPWLFLFWEDIDFSEGSTNELHNSGWSETNYRWTDYLSSNVDRSKS